MGVRVMSSCSHPDAEYEITYSTLDAARLAGVSYRMIDYWLRTGRIVIADDPNPGSGGRRRFTRTEVEALVECVAHYRSALDVLDEFRSGELWRKMKGRADDRPRADAGYRAR